MKFKQIHNHEEAFIIMKHSCVWLEAAVLYYSFQCILLFTGGCCASALLETESAAQAWRLSFPIETDTTFLSDRFDIQCAGCLSFFFLMEHRFWICSVRWSCSARMPSTPLYKARHPLSTSASMKYVMCVYKAYCLVVTVVPDLTPSELFRCIGCQSQHNLLSGAVDSLTDSYIVRKNL